MPMLAFGGIDLTPINAVKVSARKTNKFAVRWIYLRLNYSWWGKWLESSFSCVYYEVPEYLVSIL
jgi:hypothetical protein